MNGELFIDGVDVWNRFRIHLLDAKELISYPPLKAPQTTSYPEEDGVDADLAEPKLDTRTFTVLFSFHGIEPEYTDLVDFLSDKGYHDFRFASLNRQYRLRIVSMPEYNYVRYLGFIKIKFADDFPMDLSRRVYFSPASSIAEKRDYLLDGRPFTDYGARILEGTYPQIVRLPETKTNALSKSNSISGVQYDAEIVSFQPKDVTLNVFFRADNLDGLWRNYDALLHDLIRPNERILRVQYKDIDQDFPCYYKKSNVKCFFPEEKIWLQTEITLSFIRSFRIENRHYFLSDENGTGIITETNSKKIRVFPKIQ